MTDEMIMEIDGLDEIELENTAVDDIESENINLIFLGVDESGLYGFNQKRNSKKQAGIRYFTSFAYKKNSYGIRSAFGRRAC